MDFLVNDRSLHGQFHSTTEFRHALGVVMEMRNAIRQSGRALRCQKSLVHTQLSPQLNFQKAVQSLSLQERGAVMSWITRDGPFWDDLRQHCSDDWIEWRKEIVTDTALGEAAVETINRAELHLVSFNPSDFDHTPILVDWIRVNEHIQVQVPNHWDISTLRQVLEASPPPINSWCDLENAARVRFNSLVISSDAFAPLAGHPFVRGAADRLMFLLATVDRLRGCFDDEGNRTQEGHQLYQDFFTGKKGDGGRGAMFSDSSDTEKKEFEAELTFPHPEISGATLFCPWHGKVQTPQLRVHFSYPIRADSSVYVVYVGAKITTR